MAAAEPPAPFAFAHGGLDRAGEAREDTAALQRWWVAPQSRLLVLDRDGRALVAADGRALARLATDGVERDAASFLGLDGGVATFLQVRDPTPGDASHGSFLDLRRIAAQLPAPEAALAAYARALMHWQMRKRYCGRCGSPTELVAGGHRAHCRDAACGQVYFPRTDPAIIVLVANGGHCLLGRQPSWPERRYSTLAGFVEPGETLEQAVAREVAEEAGAEVVQCRYVASQPWPFPASLMLGFVAETSDRRVTLGSELADACWFEADTMEAAIAAGTLVLSPQLSIAFHLIDGWYHARTGRHLQPGPAFASK
jgi:NAD+ diphosphatase